MQHGCGKRLRCKRERLHVYHYLQLAKILQYEV
jgi:hypothetical protein